MSFGSLLQVVVLLFSLLLCKNINSAVINTCFTHECNTTSYRIFENIDEDVNPCDNFYQFACGNYNNSDRFRDVIYLVNQQIKGLLEENWNDSDPKPFVIAKKLYKACINNTLTEKLGLQAAKKVLESLGGWPVLENNWNESNFNWVHNMKKIHTIGLPANNLLDVSVNIDLNDATKHIIQLNEPELGLSREVLIKGADDMIVKGYYDYMVDVAEIFGANRSKAAAELFESFKFELDLAKFLLSKEDQRNVTKLYNLRSIRELQESHKNIPFLDIINNMFLGNFKINESEKIVVLAPDYLNNFNKLIVRTPPRVQANYVIWQMVKKMAWYLTLEIRDREFNFTQLNDGYEQERSPRWKECIKEVTDSLPYATGAMYIRKYFNADTKQTALEMVKYLKDQFRDSLVSINWMDEESQKNAWDKANAIVDCIAYPDELLDDAKISQFYDNLEVDENQLLYSSINVTKFVINYDLSRFRAPVNKTDWREYIFNPIDVNAYYYQPGNFINLPAGILQGSFFHKDRPQYINFGAIGYIIGHEITHGFDDSGRQFNKNGNLKNLMTAEANSKFLEHAQCVINQYNNYTVPEVNIQINGNLTLDENIADMGGLKMAYLAYKRWQKNNAQEPKLPNLKYNTMQLFWISAAQNWCSDFQPEIIINLINNDDHALKEFRVLGPFSNLEYFAKDWHCPIGSKMNPEHKCSVW